MYEHKSININNFDMSYYEFGKNNKKTIIFLSGFSVIYPLLDMYDLVTKLEKHFRCIIIDRYGYGESSSVPGKRNSKNISNEIIEFLIKLNINPRDLIIFGHSLGTLYALDIALTTKTCSVVLLDYEKINLLTDIFTKFGYGIYCGMSTIKSMKERQDKNYIKLQIESVKAPNNIKDRAKKCLIEKIPNSCIRSELDSIFSDYKNINSRLKERKINKALLIYRKNSENVNIKLSKHIKECNNVLIDTKNHFIHHENAQVIADKIIEYFL